MASKNLALICSSRAASYEGETFVIAVMSTGQDFLQSFLPYVLAGRASDLRVGLVRKVCQRVGMSAGLRPQLRKSFANKTGN